jgi:hypothetical protein
MMLEPIRRVVTGHNIQGKSVILSDSPSPHVLIIPGQPNFGLTLTAFLVFLSTRENSVSPSNTPCEESK